MRARRHLARVNGWTTRAAASAYFRQESEICRRRSAVEWRLDLTWLSPFEVTINLRSRKPRN
jgi:hypothetical protein